MNKNIILGILLVSMVFLSACGNKSSQDISGDSENYIEKSKYESEDVYEDVVDTSSNVGSETTSIKSLISSGQSLHCTYSQKAGSISISQEFFISGNKYSLNSVTTTGDLEQVVSIINDESYLYIWDSISGQGTKMSLSFVEQTGQDYGVDTSEAHDYDCKPWKVDNSKFKPADDVEYVDLSEMFLGMQDMYPEQ